MELSLPESAAVVNALGAIPETRHFLNDPSKIKLEKLPGWNNTSYKVEHKTEKYFLRLPGKNKSVIFDLPSEKHNLAAVAGKGMYVNTIYFDEKTGIYLAPFIDTQGILTDDLLKDKKTIESAATVLSKLHLTDSLFRNVADPMSMAQKFLREVQNTQLADFKKINDTLKRVLAVQHLVLQLCPKLVPCHNDVSPYNLLYTNTGLILTDWEYSGLGDPFYDLATFSADAKLSAEQDKILLKYYKHNCPTQEQAEIRFVLYKPIVQFAKSMWLLYQLKIEKSVVSVSTFENAFKYRYQHSLDLLKSSEFKAAYISAK